MKYFKQVSKRSFAMLLVLVMCLGLLQTTAFAIDPPDTETSNTVVSGVTNTEETTEDTDVPPAEDTEVPPAEDSVAIPAEVQAFLDAVAAIPEIITPENAVEVSEYVYGPVSDAYGVLLGTELMERTDVKEAEAVYATAIEAVDAALGIDSGTFATEHPVHGAVVAPDMTLDDVPINPGVSKGVGQNAGSVTKQVGEKGFYLRCPSYQVICNTNFTWNGYDLGNCPYSYGLWAPLDYIDIKATYSTSGLIDNVAYSVGTNPYPQLSGSDCLRMDYSTVKPGTTSVTLDYYVNFEVSESQYGYCPNSGKIIAYVGNTALTAPKHRADFSEGYNWWKYQDTFTVNVYAYYTVNFLPGGDNVTNMPSNVSSSKQFTDAYTVTTQEPQRTGYTFTGWVDDHGTNVGKTAVAKWYEDDGAYVTRTLTAQWEKDEPVTPDPPEREDLFGILWNFVEVKCVSTGKDSEGKELPHNPKTYNTWGNNTINGHYEASVGEVYKDEVNNVYKVDVTLHGDVYAAMYSMEPSFGTGVEHTLAEDEDTTKTITLTWNATTEKWGSGQNKGTVLATFKVVCKKLQITSIEKKLVKKAEDIPTDVATALSEKNVVITYPNADGKIIIPKDGSVILLYSITVKGDAGKAYKVTDSNATHVGGDPMEGTIPTGDKAVIYVTRTFTASDINDKGKLVNEATVTPGKGDESSTTSTETTPAGVPTTYTVVHEYYTNGKFDGKVEVPVSGSCVGDTITKSDVVVKPEYNKNSYGNPKSMTPADGLKLTEDATKNVITLRYERNVTLTHTIEVEKSNDGLKLDEDTGTLKVNYTVKITNTSGHDLYGLRLTDVMSEPTLTKVNETDEGEPSVKLTFSDWKVGEENATLISGGENDLTHVLQLIERGTKFADKQTVTLTYTVEVESLNDEVAVKVKLNNEAEGASWSKAPVASVDPVPNGARAALDDDDPPDVSGSDSSSATTDTDAPDVTDKDTSETEGEPGSSTEGVIPRKYKVTYTWDGLPEGTTNPAKPADAKYLKDKTVTVDTTFEKDDPVTLGGVTYKFSGWTETVPDVEVKDGKFTMPASDVVIKGTWGVPSTPIENIKAKYLVQWLEAGTDKKLKEDAIRGPEAVGTEVKVTENDKKIDGYTFDATNSGNVLNGTLKKDEALILKLYFTKDQKPDPTYTVTYTDGVADMVVFEDQRTSGLAEGTDTPTFRKADGQHGTPANYTDSTGTEWKFTGWNPEVAEKVTGNATYTAQWGKVVEYTVEWYDVATGTLLAKEGNPATRTAVVGESVMVTDADKADVTIGGETYVFCNDYSKNVLFDTLAESGTVLKLYFGVEGRLDVTKTASTRRVKDGDQIVYTVTVKNYLAKPQYFVQLRDVLQKGLTFDTERPGAGALVGMTAEFKSADGKTYRAASRSNLTVSNLNSNADSEAEILFRLNRADGYFEYGDTLTVTYTAKADAGISKADYQLYHNHVYVTTWDVAS